MVPALIQALCFAACQAVPPLSWKARCAVGHAACLLSVIFKKYCLFDLFVHL